MKKNTKIIVWITVLIAVVAAVSALYLAFAPKSTEGTKQITIEVVLPDNTVHEYPITTDKDYLGQVLREENIAQGEDGPYGLYIKTVDGITVDDRNEEWWCLTKNGGQTVETSADQLPLVDGEVYELTFTVGY